MIETGHLVQWVGSQVFKAAWSEAKKRILGKRAEAARRILLEELERGRANVADIDQDEVAAMVFEYADAA